MGCATCSHAQVDHATGRCVHSRMRHDPAVGAVIDHCPCKRFAKAEEPTPVAEPTPMPVPEPEPVSPSVMAEEPAPEEEAEAPAPRRSGRTRN